MRPCPVARPTLTALLLSATCLALAPFPPEARAQGAAWPSKPVRIIIPVTPGGSIDLIFRAFAPRLTETLGQQVIVENRPGASSLVGSQFVAKSPPDGQTLLAIANTFTSAPAIVPNAGYDPIRDFSAISLVAHIPMVVVVSPSLPVRSLKELVSLARARPGQLSYGTAGTGSTGHIAAELFSGRAGIRFTHIPYKGNMPAMMDLMGGQVALMFDLVGSSRPFVSSGKLRALAVTTASRATLFPDVPTIAESGYPGYENAVFNGVVAPAGTPPDVVARLHGDFTAAARQGDIRRRMVELGVELKSSASPDEFGTFLRAEVARYAKLVRDAGIKAE